jgi:hypothetical protein
LQDNDSLALAAEAQVRLHTGCTDPDPKLARLINAWPQLPDYVRRAIMTLVDGHQ